MTNKDLSYYLSLPYTIELIPDEDGFWFAQIPLLRGCMTQGASRAEALEMLDDAKRLWLESGLARGIPIPEPAKCWLKRSPIMYRRMEYKTGEAT